MLEMVSCITALYTQVDQQVKAFQLMTGLRCPAGCGACCPTADVHATILEMLPAAHEILCQGASAFWLERLENEGSAGICVFYCAQPAPEAQGHCGMYALRPTVCRLFGFAAVRSRSGALALSVCRQIKAASPDAAADACASRVEAPCFSDIATQINALDMAFGSRLMPINEALRRAVQRLGLAMQLGQSESLGSISAA
jgi:Fe-S-cluster containining protein